MILGFIVAGFVATWAIVGTGFALLLCRVIKKADREQAAGRDHFEAEVERLRAYASGEWCGECRYGVAEHPACCTQYPAYPKRLGMTA